MEKYTIESLDELFRAPTPEETSESLLERIRNSGVRLDAKGSEISKTLLGLAQNHNYARAQDYIDAFIDYCDRAGIQEGKRILSFYGSVADWYLQAKHKKIHGEQAPEDESSQTRRMVSVLTGYQNN